MIQSKTTSPNAPGDVFFPQIMVLIATKKKGYTAFPHDIISFFTTKNGKRRLCIPMSTIP